MPKRKPSGIHAARQHLGRQGPSPEQLKAQLESWRDGQRFAAAWTLRTRKRHASPTCGHCGDSNHRMPTCLDLLWPARWAEIPPGQDRSF